jgi:hypothetical protein
MRAGDARGRLVESSTVRITGIKTFEEGVDFAEDLCALISFARHTRVAPYEFKFGNRKRGHGISAGCNAWRPPLGSGVGKLTDFLAQTWPAYRKLKQPRALAHLFHLLTMSDAEGTVLETKVTISVQCLESIKSYFALTEGARFNIRETAEGKFVDAKGNDVSYRKLLTYTLQDVGMPLPKTFDRIAKLRNALIHRGFIRETDAVTRHTFGTLTSGAMHTAIFETMEHVQDMVREFVLRLLNYKGPFLLYSECQGSPIVLK